jgi:hypothetical protein
MLIYGTITDVATETSLMGSGKRNYQTQIKDFREYFSQWKHAKVLLATSACWFLLYVSALTEGRSLRFNQILQRYCDLWARLESEYSARGYWVRIWNGSI